MLHFKVVSGVYFRTIRKHLRLSFYENKKQKLPASIMFKLIAESAFEL